MTTKIVGILNITPDSFSDGGKFDQQETALQQLNKMLIDGADVIDIGAESTRPNAKSINYHEEISRLEKILPLAIEAIKKFNFDHKKTVQISVDTRHVQTAQMACQLGANIINDVSGLDNPEMVELIAKNNLTTVFMHSISVPADPTIIINQGLNVVQEILLWARQKIAYFEKKSIKKAQLIFDPGIGFSKNAKQSIRIIRNIESFRILDLPIYIGHSKKSFLDEINIDGLQNDISSREQKTLIISQYLADKKVDYIRVHDVLENKKAIEKKP